MIVAIRQIREYGDEILRKKSREVDVVDDLKNNKAEIEILVENG